MHSVRRAVSLIELLVVIGIFAVMLGLMLVAIQKTRRAANRVTNANNLRQIALATHNYADAHGGRLPAVVIRYPNELATGSLFGAILPYIEQGAVYREVMRNNKTFLIHVFVNPDDPTVNLPDVFPNTCSYGANAELFFDGPRFTDITDGTSSTIAFAEHYSVCRNQPYSWSIANEVPITMHRATFAEHSGLGFPADPDVYPVTEGNPPLSYGSVRGLTFQAGPKITECHPGLAQSPNPAGMQIALADGSIQTINARIAETVYWSLVTPRGGEVIPEY